MYKIEVIERIRDYMVSNKHTLSTAESVTSGHLQAAISLATQASSFFQGGITTYNLGQKARHLHVNPIHATSCNSVSENVADEMSLNALNLFSSDWAVSVTGYASPLPELGIKDLFAFYAIAFRKEVVQRGKLNGHGADPMHVQVHYTNELLAEFKKCLERRR